MGNFLTDAAKVSGVRLPIEQSEYLQTGGQTGEGLVIGGLPFRVKPTSGQIESWARQGGVGAVAALRKCVDGLVQYDNSASGYDGEPVMFPADPLAEVKEDEVVLGLFRHTPEDALEPLYIAGSEGLDLRKES